MSNSNISSTNNKIFISNENLLFKPKIIINLTTTKTKIMEKSDSLKRKTFTINQKNNRFILKCFGEMDHNYITIEKDEILTISKMHADNFEKKGQITKWVFNLDQIYSQDTTFDELYENEIENTDFLHEFNKHPQYNTITFIGDRNDSLTDSPYKEFINKCIKECMNGMRNVINISDNITQNNTLIPLISFCELNKSCVVDYLKENNINNDNPSSSGNVILNPKLNIYEDDIIIRDLTQVKVNNENEVTSLLILAKKNLEYFKINKWNAMPKDESLTQIMTLKLLKSNTNECYSKINFVLYKAYEILDTNKTYGITNPPSFNLYTKDNYNFFNAVKNKENYRLNYAIKYLRDTLAKGRNLFIMVLPCEYKYLLLMHDLLNNIKMRKLIVENTLLSDEEEESNNQLGEIYRFENVSELNFDNKDKDDNDSFQSFSKNNSIITNVSSAFDGKGKYIWNNSYYENKSTEVKNTRKEINYERLRKIDDKSNVINLFDILDKLSLPDWKLYE